MANTVISHSISPEVVPPGIRWAVAVVLALWLALVAGLGAAGAFVAPPGSPPFAIAIGALAPIALFAIAYRISPAFRNFVLAADIRPMLAIQAWRFAGLAFIALYVHGVLPGMFAWPAGLGDMAIGATAPWLIDAINRQPAFASSRTFVAWNLLGIADLVIAVATGTISSMLASGIAGEVTSGPMAQLPLVMIPAYLVPIFVMLHLAALIKARRTD